MKTTNFADVLILFSALIIACKFYWEMLKEMCACDI